MNPSKSGRSDEIDEDEMKISATHYLATGNKSNVNIEKRHEYAPRMSDFSTLGPVIAPGNDNMSPISARKPKGIKS